MWKPSQTGSSIPNPTPEPQHWRPRHTCTETPARLQAGNAEQATLGKGLFIKGEITGSESLYIDGKVEGAITLPGNRVTIGRNGQVGPTSPRARLWCWARCAATSQPPTAWTFARKGR
jgi:hypothetical protein